MTSGVFRAARALAHVVLAALLGGAECRGGLLLERSGRVFPAAKPQFGVVPPERRSEGQTRPAQAAVRTPAAQKASKPSPWGEKRAWTNSSSRSGELRVEAVGREKIIPRDFAKPKVYFLVLAVDKVSNLNVWLNFFASAPADEYMALVHCKLESCKVGLRDTVMRVVPTVPSYYCTDLVSPMNQLLSEALRADPVGHPMDKFAFVSDSTLPGKPFAEVYAALTGRHGSGFCIFPSGEWADVRANGVFEVAPKHHQWVTLDRGHAQDALTKWSAGHLHDFMRRFHMNSQAYSGMNNSFADSRNFGCLDEFWHMAAIYGPIKQAPGTVQAAVILPNFVGGPLQIAASAGWQGKCDTFVVWSKYLYAAEGTTGAQNSFERLHSALDPSSVPHGGNDQRPGWWDTISTDGMRAIRWSDFLFVRKFIDNPSLADGAVVGGTFASWYSQIVLK